MAWWAGLSLLRALGPWPRRLGPVLLLQRHRVALAFGLASTLAAVECTTERGWARDQLLRAVRRGEAAGVIPGLGVVSTSVYTHPVCDPEPEYLP
jgi:hypothetical protein